MRFREWLQFTEAMKRIQLSPSKKYLTIAEMEWEYSDSRGNFSNRAKNSELKINEYIGKPPDHISNQFINQEVIVIEGMSWFSHHEGNVSLEAYVEYTNQETTGMKSVAIEDGSKINGFLVWRGPFRSYAQLRTIMQEHIGYDNVPPEKKPMPGEGREAFWARLVSQEFGNYHYPHQGD